MKVYELIQRLQKYPSDVEIYCDDNADGFDRYNRFDVNEAQLVVLDPEATNKETIVVLTRNVL